MTTSSTFRAGTFGMNGVSTRSLGKPAAVYPGAVAADSDLMIAVDRQQTQLAATLNATDTSMTVLNPSIVIANNLLSIDNEIVATTGAPAGNVVPISRGFDGTTPAIHLASAAVSGFVDAYHHNRLVAEIEAIEQTLGANLSKIPTSPFIVSSAYNFAPQTPGGNLIAGSNVINLAPVPAGINGSNTNHSVYISGGTGTAEAALITGGTAVSGAPSGTLIIQCANTHSGAWTIQSASAGIVEAFHVLPAGGGLVIVPAGIWNIYATVIMAKSYVNLWGFGRVASTLKAMFSSGPLISLTGGDQNGLANMYLLGPSAGSAFAITMSGANNTVLQNITINSFPNGISLTGSTSGFSGSKLYIAGITGDGVFINTPVAGGTWNDTTVWGDQVNTTSKGFHVTQCVGLNLLNVYTNGTAYGMYIDPVSGAPVSVIEAVNFDSDGFAANSVYGLLIQPANGAVSAVKFHLGGFGGFKSAGVYFQGSGTVTDVIFDGLYIAGNGSGGIGLPYVAALTVKNVSFTNCLAEANSATTSGSGAGLFIQNGTNIQVRGGVYAAGSYGNGANNQGYGIQIGGGTQSVQIVGAVVAPNVGGPIFVAGSNPGLVIKDCIGYNPVGRSAITVTASPFTYTASSSPEIVYIFGGTVSNVSVGSTQVAASSPAQVTLYPNEALTVTYSAAPTMVKDVQ